MLLAFFGAVSLARAEPVDSPIQIAPELPAIDAAARADAPILTSGPVEEPPTPTQPAVAPGEEPPVAPQPEGVKPPGAAPPPAPEERIPRASSPPAAPVVDAPIPATQTLVTPSAADPQISPAPQAAPAAIPQTPGPAAAGAPASPTAAAAPPPAQIAAVVGDMKSLIEQGRFAEAFNLGLKNEILAGEPLYDYYFGIAAVDSGRASLGVLALERVLLSNPGNDLARLELARGYFVLEDYERAREEFTILLGKQLPPTVKESVEKYLNAIRQKDPQFRNVIRGYLEYTIGHNSNVNSSPDQIIFFPDFFGGPPFPVDVGRSQSSSLSQLSLGINASGPIVPGIKYLGAFDAYKKQYSSIDNYDQALGSVNLGVEFASDRDKYRLIGYYSQAYLDSSRLRDTTGVLVDWTRPLSADLLVRSGLSFSKLRYPAPGERDADLPNFTFGFSKILGGEWKSSLDVEASVGRERNLKGNRDLSRDIYGLKVGWGFLPGGRWSGSLIGSYAKSNYDDLDPIQSILRRDNLYGLEFGLQYQLTRGWSARGELIYNKNVSNVDLYQYAQEIGLFKMRYEWK